MENIVVAQLSQETIKTVRDSADLLQLFSVPHWLIIIIIVLIVIGFFWQKIEPVLDWIAKGFDYLFKISRGKRQDKAHQLINIMYDDVKEIKVQQVDIRQRVIKLEEESELHKDRQKIYSQEQLDLALNIEIEVDDWLFEQFWARICELGEDNYNIEPLIMMWKQLEYETAERYLSMRNSRGVSPYVQKLMDDTDIPTNKYAQLYFKDFLKEYQDKDLNPRMKFLKIIVDNAHSEYKNFYEDEFKRLVKRALHG